jgi:microcystin degradation protein MlrC
VQPWLDIPELGSAVVMVADRDAELARSACFQLAADVWWQRRSYSPELLPVAQAVRAAHEVGDGLVVLSDSADATTSGAPGDSTHVLRELLKYAWPRPALITLTAPDVVEEAQRRGLGAEWTTPLGGIRDGRFSQPRSVMAQVAGLFEARFVMSGHLAKIVAQLRAAGETVLDEELARISPLASSHVIPNGTYHFRQVAQA